MRPPFHGQQQGIEMKKGESATLRRAPTPKETVIMVVEGLAFLAQLVLCVLFYNYLALSWLCYLGWALLGVAMVLGWRARVAFETKGEAPQDEGWLHTTVVVDSGIYGLVRHPMYLSFMLIPLALALLSQHWLTVLLGALLVGLIYSDMGREERSSLAKFGDAYRDYMGRVPRVNLLAGMVRRARRQNKDEGTPGSHPDGRSSR
jgi:protein-S-isoprenylcysteine O-methyltransferase Ste14